MSHTLWSIGPSMEGAHPITFHTHSLTKQFYLGERQIEDEDGCRSIWNSRLKALVDNIEPELSLSFANITCCNIAYVIFIFFY